MRVGRSVAVILVSAGCTGSPGPLPAPTTTAPRPSPRPATMFALAAPAEAPRARHAVELTLTTDGVWANPFDPSQVDLRVTFALPGRVGFAAPAFWYAAYDPATLTPVGEPGWRVRFTPPAPGAWTATATLARPSLGSTPLALTVAADPAAAGDVGVHVGRFAAAAGGRQRAGLGHGHARRAGLRAGRRAEARQAAGRLT